MRLLQLPVLLKLGGFLAVARSLHTFNRGTSGTEPYSWEHQNDDPQDLRCPIAD